MILEGTTASGAVVPVQVTADGKVVAEGRTGPEGPQGPEGPEGPQGPEGPAGSPGNLWSGSDPGTIYYTGGPVGIGQSSFAVGRVGVLANNNAEALSLISRPSDDYCELHFRNSADDGTLARISTMGGDNFAVRTGTAEAFRVDGSQRLLVGTSSAPADAAVVVAGNMGVNLSPAIQWFVRKQNAGSIAANADIAFLRFGSQDGGRGAEIVAEADAAWGANNYPARLVFSTTANGASSPTERMTIDSRGDVIFQGAPIIKSADGKHWAIEVDNNGNLSASLVI